LTWNGESFAETESDPVRSTKRLAKTQTGAYKEQYSATWNRKRLQRNRRRFAKHRTVNDVKKE
jgi:hypothetical protein